VNASSCPSGKYWVDGDGASNDCKVMRTVVVPFVTPWSFSGVDCSPGYYNPYDKDNFAHACYSCPVGTYSSNCKASCAVNVVYYFLTRVLFMMQLKPPHASNAALEDTPLAQLHPVSSVLQAPTSPTL